MEIQKIHSKDLRNEEHNSFQDGVVKLVEAADPVALGIDAEFVVYKTALSNEKEAIEYISKNSKSDLLTDLDTIRDRTFRGLALRVESDCYHYDATVSNAANKLQSEVFNKYGNIAKDNFQEEISSVNNLIADLTGTYATEIGLLGIDGWINALQQDNTDFNEMYYQRIDEESAKTQLRMKQVRIQVDAAYNVMVNRINALIIVNGEAHYKDFVLKLNELLNKTKNTLAQRKGRNAKNDSGK